MTDPEFLFFPARERRPGRIFLRKRFLETTALPPAALYDRWMVAMKERQHFLDVLRVAAACAVVLMHTVTAVMDNMDMSPYPAAQKLFPAVRDLVSWCVPVFILISGYLFLRPDRNLTFGRMVTKYCRRIVLALFLFGVPYSWIELAVTEGGFRTGMLWQGIVNVLRRQSWAHMWYLYLILFLYLLTPAVRWMLERVPKAALYALAAALLFGSSILPFICQLPEYIRLGSVLSQNLRKGAKGLTDLLETEAEASLNERKNHARKIGERAGTKLLLPMVLMLGIVLVVLMVPAFLSF